MTLTQLEYIIAVDTHRHFATAAEHCFVTQPTLSMQIQKLEDDLDCKIFDRSKQPVVPTEIGVEIIRQARVIIHESRLLYQLVKDRRGKMEGELRIGIIPTLAPYLIPLFLQSFLKKYPDVAVRIKEMMTDQLMDQLKSGRIDAALLATPLEDTALTEYPLFQEELVAYVSRSNAAYRKNFVLPGDIDPKELWLMEEGHCFRNQMMHLCELRKLHPGVMPFEYEAGSVETLRKMVEMNQGVTILPELATLDMTPQQQELIRHFKGALPVREISLVTHRDFLKEKLLDALRDEIVAQLPEKFRKSRKTQILKVRS